MAINNRIVQERPVLFRPNMTAVTAKENVTYYARVSTESEEQEDSYERQKAHFEEIILSNPKWNYVQGYADWGVSGTKAETRREFMRMIADCREKKINRILVKSISRFGRNTVDTLKYIRELRELGVSVYFEVQNIDTMTAGGDVLITILAAMAEQESRTMSTNIKWAYQKRFKDGKVLINPLSLGYRKEGDGYVIVEEEAEIIRRIFRNYLSGDSVRQIADELNAAGIRTKRGNEFKANAIINILSNEKYTGNAILGKTFKPDVLSKRRLKNEGQAPSYEVKNSHPSIISQEMFDLVQAEKLRRNTLRSSVKTGKGKYSRKYVLSGLLVCGQCGAKLRRFGRALASGEYVPTWVCVTHQKNRAACDMKPLKETDILDAYKRAVGRLLGDAGEILEIVKAATKEGLDLPDTQSLDNIEEKLIRTRKKVLELFKDKRDGNIPLAEYETRYADLSNQIVELERQESEVKVRNIESQLAQKRLDDALALLSNPRVDYMDDTVIRHIVDVIKVNGKHELEFQFKCGVDIKEDM